MVKSFFKTILTYAQVFLSTFIGQIFEEI